jgi:DNA-binding NtrC family response regulator
MTFFVASNRNRSVRSSCGGKTRRSNNRHHINPHRSEFIRMTAIPNPSILIVDDERALLLSYQIIFKRAGYVVTTADTTAGALDLLRHQDFDLLLCDLSMERENSGLTIVDEARKVNRDTGIILMTGYSRDTIPQQVVERRTNIVFKPIEIPRLLETVDFTLRGRKHHGFRRRA